MGDEPLMKLVRGAVGRRDKDSEYKGFWQRQVVGVAQGEHHERAKHRVRNQVMDFVDVAELRPDIRQ